MEFPFHYIQDDKEAANIHALIGDKKVVTITKTISADTFQPLIFFAIEDPNKPFAEWDKYVAPMALELVKVEEKVEKVTV
jgi:hypothetical protein